MKFFSSIAKRSFQTSLTGDRLFFRYGMLSKPFIVPDNESEQKIFNKQRLFLMIVLIGFLLCSFLYEDYLSLISSKPPMFIALIGFLFIVSALIKYFIFYSVLKNLSRTSARIPIKEYFTAEAQENNQSLLMRDAIFSGLFVIAGILLFFIDERIHPVIIILCTVFFGVYFLIGVYTLYIKTKK